MAPRESGIVTGAQVRELGDGRLHLHHGPIDIIFEVFGDKDECTLAMRQAAMRFDGLLEGLVLDLPALRRPVSGKSIFCCPVAKAMADAVLVHAPFFVTPMAAVAGAVADAVLAAAVAGRKLQRAYANNGGDAALYLGRGESLTVAIANGGSAADRAIVRASDPSRGVATSGWRGRSHSMGIADAVTVLARNAAAADVAATLIANAVDLPGSAKVTRVAAHTLDPDSDLGERAVTRAVAPLDPREIETALDRGSVEAEAMRRRGLIDAAALYLGGRCRIIGPLNELETSKERETCDG